MNLQDMASERLTRAAYEGLYEAVNLKRLIAFVGSGVSLVYGSLTWRSFRDEVISNTRRAVEDTKKDARTEPRQRLDLQRALDSLDALSKSDMDDAGMVFDLCERAYNLIQQVEDRRTSGFGSMLQEIFRSDEYFATKTLRDRMALVGVPAPGSVPGAAPAKTGRASADGKGVKPEAFYRSLCKFYSEDTLQALVKAAHSSPLADLMAMLKEGSEDWAGPLPIDRRSLTTIFLAFGGITAADAEPVRDAAATKYRHLFPGGSPAPASAAVGKPELAPPRPLLDPLLALSNELNIGRYLTTNYDLELENLFMFEDVRQQSRLPMDLESLNRVPGFWSADEGRSWTRRLENGGLVRSDVYDGVSTSRLFEFAIGSTENSCHIFHMHGRADRPDTMIATDSDYNRQYREDRVSRPSFDRAYDVAISGNPILFVGSGLTEAELNRTLRHRVSNQGPEHNSPVYVLRAADKLPTELLLDQLSLFTRLGVHLIHFGHPRRGREWSLREALLRIETLAGRYGLDRRLYQEKTAPWRTRVKQDDGETFDPGTCSLCGKLTLDRKVVEWLGRTDVQTHWADMQRPLDPEAPPAPFRARGKKPARGKSRWRAPPKRERTHILAARKLLADYLDKLVEKLYTASLIHEIEEIGQEAPLLYERKATLIAPRAVQAYPKAASASPGVAAKFGVRHLPAVSDPASHATRWCTRDPGQPPTPIADLADLLPKGALSNSDRYQAVVVTGDRGTGKGTLLEILAEKLAAREDTLILNCSFGLESDSIVLLVLSFLLDGERVSLGELDDGYESRRQKMKAKLDTLPPKRRPLLVLGAVDWLFGLDGDPLSNEFEWLLRLLLTPPLKLHVMVIGSRRCERFFRTLIADVGETPSNHRMFRIERAAANPGAATGDGSPSQWAMAELLAPGPREGVPIDTVRRLRMTRGEHRALVVAGMALDGLTSFAENYAYASDVGVPPASLARLTQEMLTALAFIGLPCEGQVLMLVSDVDRMLTSILKRFEKLTPQEKNEKRKAVVAAALDFALERKLLHVIEASGGGKAERYSAGSGVSRAQHAMDKRQRFVLHRLLFRKIRNRFGLPLGETLPHSSHSLSLFASQPDDAPAAAPEVAADLAALADDLISGWPEGDEAVVRIPDAAQKRLEEIRGSCTETHYLEDARNPDRLAVIDDFRRRVGLTGPLASASLRAAGGVIRSVFSVSNILNLDVDSLGPLTARPAFISEQKLRIRRLLDRAIDLQRVRETLDKDGLKGIWEETLAGRIGAPAAGVADKLFDSPNEIADLLGPGGASADFGRRPFYEEEIVWLLNERAVLSLAQGDLYAAATTFELAFAANLKIEGDRYHPNRCRLLINHALLSIERGHIGEARRRLVEIQNGILSNDPDAIAAGSPEGRLILALAAGYEALCDDLQGLTERADHGYRETIRKLDTLRQQRAVAIFHLHRGAMLKQLPGTAAEISFAHALAAAEAGRHTDIAYRIRVAKAEFDRGRGTINAAAALAVHQAAVRYSEQFEMHRVAVQALGASTHIRLEMGDVEAAAVDCSRALALASRYGMTLYRISLRILTGRVLEKRGDFANARFMFERGASAAERRGYQRAVDVASRQIMRLG